MTTSGDNSKLAKISPVLMSCEGKKRFDSRALAAAVLEKRNRGRIKGRCIYRCRWCCGWHLGTTRSRVAKHRRHDFKERQYEHR